MGLLKEPRDAKQGLAGKRGPTVFDRVVKWRTKKTKKTKFQKDLEKETRNVVRGTMKFIKEVVND